MPNSNEDYPFGYLGDLSDDGFVGVVVLGNQEAEAVSSGNVLEEGFEWGEAAGG